MLLAAWAVLILFPLLTHPNDIPMPLVPQGTDFLITHLPNALYVHDNLAVSGHIPLWNAMMMSGQPFAGDPLSGYWYLPNWLTFWQPQPWMFTLLFLLHLVWTGLGFFSLLSVERVSPIAAFLGTMAWMATPKLIGYIGGGQVSFSYALAWTPWLLLAFRHAAEQPNLRKAALAGACLAITFLADVRWGFLGGIFAAGYALSIFHFTRANLRRLIPAALAGGLLFLALTAGLTLPLLNFMSFTRRASMTLNDLAGYSVEPLALLGLIIPPYGMVYPQVVYLGWLPLLMACLGVIRRKAFWLLATLIAGLYALGTNAFLFPLLVKVVPGLSWLRVPSQTWFIVAFCIAALASWGLDGFLVSLALSQPRRWVAPTIAATIALLTAGNLLWYDASQLTAVPMRSSPSNDWLEAQPGLFRVYSPDGSIPLPNRLQLANGVDPLHLANYASFLGKAAGMDLPGYSVSLPNIYIDQNTPPDVVDSALHPDTHLLGLLNVKYLVSGLPLQAEGLTLVQTIGKTLIYENQNVQPRAWLEGGNVEISSWSPDRITLTSAGPAGQLTLAEIVYPGWQARVDGQAAMVETVDGLLRGIALNAGRHQIVFEFHPLTVYIGAGIAGIAWIGLMLFIFLNHLNSKRTGHKPVSKL
jgi:hypothetical protein